MGRKLVSAMKDKLGKQLFEVVIQASANGDIVARETIKVYMSTMNLAQHLQWTWPAVVLCRHWFARIVMVHSIELALVMTLIVHLTMQSGKVLEFDL